MSKFYAFDLGLATPYEALNTLFTLAALIRAPDETIHNISVCTMAVRGMNRLCPKDDCNLKYSLTPLPLA